MTRVTIFFIKKIPPGLLLRLMVTHVTRSEMPGKNQILSMVTIGYSSQSNIPKH